MGLRCFQNNLDSLLTALDVYKQCQLITLESSCSYRPSHDIVRHVIVEVL